MGNGRVPELRCGHSRLHGGDSLGAGHAGRGGQRTGAHAAGTVGDTAVARLVRTQPADQLRHSGVFLRLRHPLLRRYLGGEAGAGTGLVHRPAAPDQPGDHQFDDRCLGRDPGAELLIQSGNRDGAGPPGTPRHQLFLTNSDLSFMAPMPSILQSMSCSPPIRRMFLTFVPTLTTWEEPLILRSLITVTVSPSCSTLPWASLITDSSAAASLPPSFGHS